jgi:hypothetical protein
MQRVSARGEVSARSSSRVTAADKKKLAIYLDAAMHRGLRGRSGQQHQCDCRQADRARVGAPMPMNASDLVLAGLGLVGGSAARGWQLARRVTRYMLGGRL